MCNRLQVMDNNNEVINDNNKVSKVFKYLKLKVKLKRVLSKIWFNKQCLDNNVIPKYAQVKIKNKNSVAKKVKEQSEKLWIKLEIRSLYGLINRYNRELYDRHIELLRIYSVSYTHLDVYKRQVQRLVYYLT